MTEVTCNAYYKLKYIIVNWLFKIYCSLLITILICVARTHVQECLDLVS